MKSRKKSSIFSKINHFDLPPRGRNVEKIQFVITARKVSSHGYKRVLRRIAQNFLKGWQTTFRRVGENFLFFITFFVIFSKLVDFRFKLLSKP